MKNNVLCKEKVFCIIDPMFLLIDLLTPICTWVCLMLPAFDVCNAKTQHNINATFSSNDVSENILGHCFCNNRNSSHF